MDDYHLRVQLTYKMLNDCKPVGVLAVIAATGTTQADVKIEGLDDVTKFFKHQLFLASLLENLREKVLEAKKDSFFEWT